MSAPLMVAVVVAFAGIAGVMVFGVEMPEKPKAVVLTATRVVVGRFVDNESWIVLGKTL
ncbi:hypothetical protein [Methanoculleus bourgensis]|uniref:hypothetical protein n=1 Tax=Methanoculleus bourgensis TaxID=83986 RepID=UPI0022EEF153|nr:hypothetical protein [Methanoculleus bourgensis]GLI46793.1 hypothetical protein MBOURGENBZM_15850 [Methanoculleus bourgensis]